MSLKSFLLYNRIINNSVGRNYLYGFIQKKTFNQPASDILDKLKPDPITITSIEDITNTNHNSFNELDPERLLSRIIITPSPFNRYHHLWLHKTLTNQNRIKKLPLPTPNYKIIPSLTCILHHIIINGPSTLENIWNGIQLYAIIRSKTRLKKTIKKYIEKYPNTLPFVNITKYNLGKQIETDSNSDSDTESGSESETDSDFQIDSEFSDSDSSLSTEWDTDGLQPAIYDIRPTKKDKIIEKYKLKWDKIENNIKSGKIQMYSENTNYWWYSINENRKPVAKGPILWNDLIKRAQNDQKIKSKYNKNKITNKTPVFNFAYMDCWKPLNDVLKQF